MNLREFLFYNDMSVGEFALLADLNRTFVSSILTGQRMPSPKSLRAIERATKGQVTAASIMQPTKLPKKFTKVVPLPIPKPHPIEEEEQEKRTG